MQSILSNELECYICHRWSDLHRHHIYFGANRKVSEANGFWVYLCPYHHNMSNEGVHMNRKADLMLKEACQRKFEEAHTREEFVKLIGRNYL